MLESKEERIYCAGPNWEGDGSKATSVCQFGDSMVDRSGMGADTYQCSRCTSEQTSENILVNDAAEKQEVEKAPEITSQVHEAEIVETRSEPSKLPKFSIKKKKKKRRRF